MNQQNFLFLILEKLPMYSRGRCAFAPFSRSGHLTWDKRKNARLAFFPNFAPFHSAKLLLSRYVKRNFLGLA